MRQIQDQMNQILYDGIRQIHDGLEKQAWEIVGTISQQDMTRFLRNYEIILESEYDEETHIFTIWGH